MLTADLLSVRIDLLVHRYAYQCPYSALLPSQEGDAQQLQHADRGPDRGGHGVLRTAGGRLLLRTGLRPAHGHLHSSVSLLHLSVHQCDAHGLHLHDSGPGTRKVRKELGKLNGDQRSKFLGKTGTRYLISGKSLRGWNRIEAPLKQTTRYLSISTCISYMLEFSIKESLSRISYRKCTSKGLSRIACMMYPFWYIGFKPNLIGNRSHFPRTRTTKEMITRFFLN